MASTTAATALKSVAEGISLSVFERDHRKTKIKKSVEGRKGERKGERKEGENTNVRSKVGNGLHLDVQIPVDLADDLDGVVGGEVAVLRRGERLAGGLVHVGGQSSRESFPWLEFVALASF